MNRIGLARFLVIFRLSTKIGAFQLEYSNISALSQWSVIHLNSWAPFSIRSGAVKFGMKTAYVIFSEIFHKIEWIFYTFYERKKLHKSISNWSGTNGFNSLNIKHRCWYRSPLILPESSNGHRKKFLKYFFKNGDERTRNNEIVDWVKSNFKCFGVLHNFFLGGGKNFNFTVTIKRWFVMSIFFNMVNRS